MVRLLLLIIFFMDGCDTTPTYRQLEGLQNESLHVHVASLDPKELDKTANFMYASLCLLTFNR
jgi:hypothetical protein